MYCRLRTFSKLTFVQPRIYTNTTTFFNPIQRSRWSFSTTSSEESHHDKAKKISEIVRVVGARIDSEKMIPKYNELSKAIQAEDLWSDANKAAKLLREHSYLDKVISKLKSLKDGLNDYNSIIEMSETESGDKNEFVSEANRILEDIYEPAQDLEIQMLMSQEQDVASCFVEVQAGSGGTESMDWASMLLGMYTKWATRRGFVVEEIEEHKGEVAGVKSASIKVDGEYAYGWLKSEIGVHRLVRVSPFDANARRHTSFASVYIYPAAGASSNFPEIDKKDLRIDTLRASGAGGQHVNKTDSAVRITHIPTGISVKVQADRSQHRNKDTAMEMLKARLYAIQLQKKEKQNQEEREAVGDNSWSNQIRSYVLQPYQMVKDARTGAESTSPSQMLEGGEELDKLDFVFLSQLTVHNRLMKAFLIKGGNK